MKKIVQNLRLAKAQNEEKSFYKWDVNSEDRPRYFASFRSRKNGHIMGHNGLLNAHYQDKYLICIESKSQ